MVVMAPIAIISRKKMEKTSIFFCTLSIVQVLIGDAGVHNKSMKMYSVFLRPTTTLRRLPLGCIFCIFENDEKDLFDFITYV